MKTQFLVVCVLVALSATGQTLAGVYVDLPASSIKFPVPSDPLTRYEWDFDGQPCVFDGLGDYMLVDLRLSNAIGTVALPEDVGVDNDCDSFFDIWVEISVPGGGGSVSDVLPLEEVSFNYLKIAGLPYAYATEITSLDLLVDGGGSGGGIMIRESPTRASSGQYIITDASGGCYVDSFFDVFFDISLDGGNTWHPSTTSSLLVLSQVPEPSTMVALLGGLAGLIGLRRRKA